MKVVRPLAISLTASSVPETDYPAWAAGTTYALGERVIVAALHRVFESVAGGNVGHAPAAGGTSFWIDVGPTNRWAMFDPAAGPATRSAAAIVLTLALPDAVDAIGLVDLQAASVRVEITAAGVTLLDTTRGAPTACEVFLGLPAGASRTAKITIAPAGGAAVVGKLITGAALDLGTLADAPTVGLTDFSRRETDAFGVTTIAERGWTKRIEAKCRIDEAAVDGIQRQLAALRAQAALWIGEGDFPSLISYGFYKDFSQVISLQGISTCTLSIDGLPAADIALPLTDPAVNGASDFRVVRPAAVTDAALVSSSVPENEYPAYAAGTAYVAGARVILPATHRVYESLTAGNAGHDPATDGANWLDLGPTNRWAMFDEALGTATLATGSIVLQLKPGTFADTIAVLDAVGASVRVQAPGYDQTRAIGGDVTTALFLDLALAAGDTATVTIGGATSGAAVAVGTLLIGAREGLGTLADEPTIGVLDFSVKNTDDFGNTVPLERAWAKRMEAKSQIDTPGADALLRRLATLRAKPSLWIGAAELDALTIYGFFRDFTVTLGERVSIASVTIEGLAKAAPAAPFNAAIEWENITGPGKPADNATVGAPPGTSVGGVPASAVADAIKDTAGNVVPVRDQLAATKATIDAAVALARLEAAAAQDDATQARIDLAAEVARAKGAEGTLTVDLAAVKATADGAAAGVTSEATVRAQQDLALSNRLDVTEAQLGGGQDSGLRARIANEETARANADNAIANRVLTVESTYAAASGTLNPNPSFSIWPNGQQLPTSWNAWGDGLFDLQRQADTRMLNAWCLRQAAPANVSTGVFQALPALGSAGWYVLVADVELLSGTWRGAGITLSGALNLRFDNVADSDGVLSATQLGVRHFSLLVRKDGSAWTNFHAMTNWDGFGAGREAKNLIWRHCSVRVANDAEIKAGKAFTDAGTALARITTEETTRASQDTALANRLSTTEAQLSGAQDSNLRARITNEETTRASQDNALANRITVTESQLSGSQDSGLRARISNEEITRANQDSALASRVSTTEAQLSGSQDSNLRARIVQSEAAISGLNGRTAAYWQVLAVAGNNRALIGLWADANAGAGVDIVGDVRITGADQDGSAVLSGRGVFTFYPNGAPCVRLGRW